jgi:hypothetical protein
LKGDQMTNAQVSTSPFCFDASTATRAYDGMIVISVHDDSGAVVLLRASADVTRNLAIVLIKELRLRAPVWLEEMAERFTSAGKPDLPPPTLEKPAQISVPEQKSVAENQSQQTRTSKPAPHDNPDSWPTFACANEQIEQWVARQLAIWSQTPPSSTSHGETT